VLLLTKIRTAAEAGKAVVVSEKKKKTRFTHMNSLGGAKGAISLPNLCQPSGARGF
jgi:hypothetical protein